MSLLDELTPLQFKIVLLMAAGLTEREMMDFLNLGPNVLGTIIKNIYLKTGSSGRADTVLRYVREAEEGLFITTQFRNSVVDLEVRAQQLIINRDLEKR